MCLKWINPRFTTNFFNLLRTVVYLLLIVFLHDANMTDSADCERLCFLIYPSENEKPLVSDVGTRSVSGLLLVIVCDSCCVSDDR